MSAVKDLVALGRKATAAGRPLPPELWSAIDDALEERLGADPFQRTSLSEPDAPAEQRGGPPAAVLGSVRTPSGSLSDALPFEPEEIEHYEWLIHWLLRGAREHTVSTSAVEAIEEARGLFEELVARIPVREAVRS